MPGWGHEGPLGFSWEAPQTLTTPNPVLQLQNPFLAFVCPRSEHLQTVPGLEPGNLAQDRVKTPTLAAIRFPVC